MELTPRTLDDDDVTVEEGDVAARPPRPAPPTPPPVAAARRARRRACSASACSSTRACPTPRSTSATPTRPSPSATSSAPSASASRAPWSASPRSTATPCRFDGGLQRRRGRRRPRGHPPEMFRPGIPVVLEGHWHEAADVFASDRILIKHDESYESKDDYERAHRRGRAGRRGGAGERRPGHRRHRPRRRGLARRRRDAGGGPGPAQAPPACRSAGRTCCCALVGAVLAVAAMERALITRDFTVQYVADNGSSRTPALYNVATLWAALEGSILLWVLVLTGYMALVVHKFRKRLDDPLVGWAMLDDARGQRLLLPAAAVPGQPVHRRSTRRPASTARAPTRCCRTTR